MQPTNKLALAVLAAGAAAALTACSAGGDSGGGSGGGAQPSAAQQHSETQQHSQKQRHSQTPQQAHEAGQVGRDEAGRIGTGRYGGRVLNVEPDHAKGQPTWEVEIAGSHKGRIEVDVSARDGRILEMESDNDSS